MPKKHSGRCACGAITFEFDTDPTFVADCYCLDYQKASGGAMATWFAVPEEEFTPDQGKTEVVPLHGRLRPWPRPELLRGLWGPTLYQQTRGFPAHGLCPDWQHGQLRRHRAEDGDFQQAPPQVDQETGRAAVPRHAYIVRFN